MTTVALNRIDAARLSTRDRPGIDPATQSAADDIVDRVRTGGAAALVACRQQYDAIDSEAPLVFERDALVAAANALPYADRALLERTATRIASFAVAQRSALAAVDIAVAGGRAGHALVPVDRAGCYAPAGRAPLPSSLLMTAVTARMAGVREVVVATPNPSPLMLATAGIARADVVLNAGGAHAIAALAYGVGVGPADIVVGPGNKWVTAAKRRVAGDVAIDMLAGPSELVVLADATADPRVIAADLLAQAEHDPDAFVALVTTERDLVSAVDAELNRQLATLPTAPVARASLANAIAVVCPTLAAAIAACDTLAPEHLELAVADADGVAARVRHAGAVFVGAGSAEVFGDYGIGGNHVLPTQRGARYTAGLSVYNFMRPRAWLRMDQPEDVIADVAALARLEGLEAHARAAEARRAPAKAR
jgi:histidinol dehydrogenase